MLNEPKKVWPKNEWLEIRKDEFIPSRKWRIWVNDPTGGYWFNIHPYGAYKTKKNAQWVIDQRLATESK